MEEERDTSKSMHEVSKRSAQLLAYLRNELDAEEAVDFVTWLESEESGEQNKRFVDTILQEDGLKQEMAFFSDTGKAQAWTDLHTQLVLLKKHKFRTSLWIAAAASIVLILSIGLYFYGTQNGHPVIRGSIQGFNAKNDIPAGKTGATLTLGNGKKIILSDAVKGQLASETGVNITKTADGQVVYTVTKHQSLQSSGPIEYNTLGTTKGQQYQVILPDGTKCWLNAATTLKYPSTFAHLSQRRVELNGEAYFEVAKVFKSSERIPFIVVTKKQRVEVLGTHFNINSYPDEPDTKTTLLEGSVLINGTALLKPGEQAADLGKTIKITRADTELALAWKNNKFMFRKYKIQDIMRMVARWYNVDVVYVGEIPDDLLGGSVSRFDNISKVLNILELTGNVHFKIEGRRITVTK